MPQSPDKRKNWTPPPASTPSSSAPLPQFYIGGGSHPLKHDPMKRYGSQDDWYELGQNKVFGSKPVLRST